MLDYTFEIDGKVYVVNSNPLDCGLSDREPVEAEEPVGCYAESNEMDKWGIAR